MKPRRDKTTQESCRKKTLRSLVVVCTLVVTLQPLVNMHEASAKTISYERGISRVKGFIARKQFGDAERLLSAMLRDYPGNPEILSLRGRVYLWNGKPSAAISDFNRALRRREDPSVRNELGKAETAEQISRANIFLSQGKTAEAERILISLFDARRDRYTTGLLLGKIYTNSANYGNARDLYRTLHQDYPRDHDITLLYIRSLIMAGNPERAEQEVALLPGESHPSLHLARAAVLKTRGEYAEAVESYRRALKLQDDPSVRKEMQSLETLVSLRKADAALTSGKPELAEGVLRPLYSAGISSYDAGHRLARIAVNRKDYDETLTIYRRLLNDYPSDNDTVAAYLDTLLIAGKTDAAGAYLATLPGERSPELRLRYARLLYRTGRYAEAVEEYRRLQSGATDPSVADEAAKAERTDALWRANRLDAGGKTSEAEQIWRNLYESGKERYESGVRLARLYQKRGEFDRAATTLGELCKAYPADQDLRLALIDALLAAGNLVSAERELTHLADDHSPQVSLRRGRLMYRLKRYEEAVQSFKTAGDTLEPTVRKEREAAENSLALSKALTLMRAGKLEEAKALWNELFLSGRERYESGYQLGMAYLRQRDFMRAREHFTGLSEEFPKDPGFFALAVESNLLSRDVKTASAMVRDASPERADYLRREREDLIYRVHPNYAQISGLLAGYDHGISSGRELALTISQRIDPATVVINAATVHRYDKDDAEFGAEVTFPLQNRPYYGTLGLTYSPDANFLPQTTFRGEGTYVRNGMEYSLGYTRMNFRDDGVNILVAGVLGYLAPTVTLSERLYVVPEKGTFSLLSTLHYEPTHLLRSYYSLGIGTASETNHELNATDRYFTVSNRLGVEYRPIASISGGGEIFDEFRDGLYNRYGIQLFVKYWW
ncbi:tetratricopeptide repeat protein [Geobacter hydrogenophilus]|uniref:YaiO beta-barrel domain-containing protein n=1 Tax=Geobacter hydrogenophilus TaxID=40983 RepID=A0A9W6LE66_9BACT|nr:tetratricopeptide repeat protein [Geobacter hydrogenophilus]MBT0892968.1 tetratricopeptide repeat protein [Geobacter hydrogenophilus]GLI39196.1 hypothetical protein GHYDROH2_26970 [Geobacter hydrogenophilus]